MALGKVEETHPRDREAVPSGKELQGLDIYGSESKEKIGRIEHLLVEETGNFSYLVIDMGFWIFGKKVLLPLDRTNLEVRDDRVYALGLTKKEAKQLPQYHDGMAVNEDYREQYLRGQYSIPATEESAPVEASPPVECWSIETLNYTERTAPDRASPPVEAAGIKMVNIYSVPDVVSVGRSPEPDRAQIRLHEEKLVANKSRRKTGDVVIGKQVETETAKFSVPVDKERVIIEHRDPREEAIGNACGRRPIAAETSDFQEGEIARLDIYEEKAAVRKEAFVREEVDIRKEVDRDVVRATEELRREELDIDVEGNPDVRS